jgi:hypothetical protein
MNKSNAQAVLGDVRLEDSGSILTIESTGAAMIAWGATVPTDADTGYATGCLFIHTDGGDGTALYVNEGDEDSCDFNAISVA